MKLHEEFKLYETMWDESNALLDPIDTIVAEIESGAKALVQSSPLKEATKLDLNIDNAEVEAEQAEDDKYWKKNTSWLERVKNWFADKVLQYVLKNEKVYNALITNAFEGRFTENYLVDITYDLQQIHWSQIEDVSLKNAAKTGVDTSNLALKVISKEPFYGQEKFFVQVLKLIRSGAVKDIYEAVRVLDLELFEYQLVSKHLLESDINSLTEDVSLNISMEDLEKVLSDIRAKYGDDHEVDVDELNTFIADWKEEQNN